MGFPEASTLPMNAMTARLALDVLDLPPGGTVAVTGAAGAVGGYAVEPASADGLTMIADAAPRDVETVRGFGADHVVERGAGIAERFRALVPEGVAGVVDGSAQTADLVPAISDGGTLVELGTGRAGHQGMPGDGPRSHRRHGRPGHSLPSGRGRRADTARRTGAACRSAWRRGSADRATWRDGYEKG
ncbi:hypothetical protein ACFY7Z_25955 [Streptomyces sp. NPDC012623]|uniref:hypothetical protein n=1 Tax=unclassified Streptomyces TaxID=2593676 RepID=UPI0036C0EFB3